MLTFILCIRMSNACPFNRPFSIFFYSLWKIIPLPFVCSPIQLFLELVSHVLFCASLGCVFFTLCPHSPFVSNLIFCQWFLPSFLFGCSSLFCQTFLYLFSLLYLHSLSYLVYCCFHVQLACKMIHWYHMGMHVVYALRSRRDYRIVHVSHGGINNDPLISYC